TRASDARPIPGARLRGAGIRGRLRPARGAAECQDRRHLRAIVEARRQAALPRDDPARLGRDGTRPEASRARSGRRLVRRQYPARAARHRRGRIAVNALVSDSAMVLAAGLGTRMRPLTNDRPKPLVEVAGKPLIDHALDRLAEAGVARAVVNVHHFGDAVEAHVGGRTTPAITISDERALLLETGGGLVKAQDLLSDPFFCAISDNVWLDGPKNAFQELSDAWDPERMDALLLLASHTQANNFRGKGDFHMDGRGRL